jgi:hypothetical protein
MEREENEPRGSLKHHSYRFPYLSPLFKWGLVPPADPPLFPPDCATHARPLHPAALAFVFIFISYWIELVRARVRVPGRAWGRVKCRRLARHKPSPLRTHRELGVMRCLAHPLRGSTTTPTGASDCTTIPNRLHTQALSPKRLAHPRSPIPPLSTLTARATHARPLHPAALASVLSGIVLVRVRVRSHFDSMVRSASGQKPPVKPPLPLNSRSKSGRFST